MPQVTPNTPVTVTGTRTANVVGANAGVQLKTGKGVVTALTVNTAGTGSTLVVYDGTSTAGAKIATMSTAAQVAFAPLNWSFATGLFVVTTGANSDITVAYQ